MIDSHQLWNRGAAQIRWLEVQGWDGSSPPVPSAECNNTAGHRLCLERLDPITGYCWYAFTAMENWPVALPASTSLLQDKWSLLRAQTGDGSISDRFWSLSCKEIKHSPRCWAYFNGGDKWLFHPEEVSITGKMVYLYAKSEWQVHKMENHNGKMKGKNV